jgi:hypothetical protein
VATVFDGIDEHLGRWIASQALFFVGTAPLTADGHVNVSPKGPIETLRILDSSTVAYLAYEGLRPHQDAWAQKKVRVGGEAALLDYQREKNAHSIDGLPALDRL